MVHFVVEIEGHQTCLERLLQKDTLFLHRPFNGFLAHINLERQTIGDIAEIIHKRANYEVGPLVDHVIKDYHIHYLLSLAVLALAIAPINDRDDRIS